ncbi:adenosine deaminase [Streptosporangium sp. NPDC051022]|uniref:adenosine deaminase n=1 Tax=Streptosporangium sp. NPDC051022 TaxID=3155752 RepID=UPI003430B403
MPRPLTDLPKAHLHLHFTGSMRHTTLIELAREQGLHLPNALEEDWPPRLRATDERGWFRFQRLYDIARAVLKREEYVYRLLREAAEDEAAEGSRWLEIQVDPSGYAQWFGGLTPTLELMLDAARRASLHAGVGVAVVVAANRTRHPLDAKTLARLASRHMDRGVVGFGLSNDERRGRARDFDGAFRLARRAGLLAVPHGGELMGADSVAECLDELGADRIGHGVRAAESPRLMERLAARQIACEVCPTSNVGLGVAERAEDVPLRRLFEAGVPIALGADDPLLFGARLLPQYELARDVYGFRDAELAELARQSIRASAAPEGVRKELLREVDDWLAAPDPAPGPGRPADAPAPGQPRA